MSDLGRRLSRSLGDSYRVERELGGGGMARVFLVTDMKLGRPVTIKVLEPDLAQGVSAERFAREIRIVAQLQHPNIVPILSAGELDGLPYYTMPFVAGRSARALLTEGSRLPIHRIVEILRDVARALDAAHRQGIVHRDIKPDNILLSDNAASVCDFGIAKAVVLSRTPSHTSTLTGIGVSIGTPAYMAPEQALGGEEIDHRADIYAFGATAYELLTGKPPFADRPTSSLLRAHVSEEPEPIMARRADTPASLGHLVMSCLAKAPNDRPASATELLKELDEAASGVHVARAPARNRAVAGALGVVAAAAVAVVVALQMRASSLQAGELPSVVVLPFANLSGDSTVEYFSDGMTEQLVSDLGRANGLRVAPRAVTFAQKGKAMEPRALAASLRVGLLVSGSVRRNGDQFRVEAELMNAETGDRIWSDRYDRRLDDVFLVQEEIARSITSALKISVVKGLRLSQRTDGATYDLYLRGRHFQRSRDGVIVRRREFLDSAVQLFNRAIARDSSFAPAWAGLSDAYRHQAEYFTPLTVLPRAKEAARRAVQLDPTDLSAGIALANITLNFDWNWDAAEREYRRVLALHPTEPSIHWSLAELLASSRRFDEALQTTERAFELEFRQSTDTSAARSQYLRRVAWINRQAGRRSEAERALAELTRLYPNSPATHYRHGWVLVGWDPEQAARRMELARPSYKDQLPYLTHLGAAYGLAGHRDTARRIMTELHKRSTIEYVPKDQFFTLYLALGDKREALRWLHRAVDEHHWWLPYINAHPQSEPVRYDPEYQRFLARIGVPPSAR